MLAVITESDKKRTTDREETYSVKAGSHHPMHTHTLTQNYCVTTSKRLKKVDKLSEHRLFRGRIEEMKREGEAALILFSLSRFYTYKCIFIHMNEWMKTSSSSYTTHTLTLAHSNS